MKISVLVFFALIIFTNCPAQTQYSNIKTQEIKVKVKVKNWARVSMFSGDQFWSDKKEQLEKQLGLGAVDSVRKYSDLRNLPPQMLLFDGHSKKKLELNEYAQKMDSLKCLLVVASFNHVFQGQDFGTWYVIQVPYLCNEKWDTLATKWDKVYFIFDGQYIEVIN